MSGDRAVSTGGFAQGAAGSMSSARVQKASLAGGAGHGPRRKQPVLDAVSTQAVLMPWTFMLVVTVSVVRGDAVCVPQGGWAGRAWRRRFQ